jgi:hypothetical protein
MPAWLLYLFLAAGAAVLTIAAVPHLPSPADEIFTWVGWLFVIGLLIYAAFAFFGSRPRV